MTFDTFQDALKLMAKSKYDSDEDSNVGKIKCKICESSGPSTTGTTVGTVIVDVVELVKIVKMAGGCVGCVCGWVGG